VRGVPDDYYRRLHEVDTHHWWHRGMRSIEAALLGDRLQRTGQSVLDAGCGTGGFLAWAASTGAFDRLAGSDVSAEAIELAREVVPVAELRVAPLDALPFPDRDFDLVVVEDVLQHVHQDVLDRSFTELRRVVRPDGALLVRTNGGRHARNVRADWRLYDAPTLAHDLERGGFRPVRLTYANLPLSAAAAAFGRSPQAPTDEHHGIPEPDASFKTAVGSRLLGVEARYLARPGRSLPYGHTLLALAVPDTAG
jgi:ubiquinone/menaquinone biosynthesis C-methylase UbiE